VITKNTDTNWIVKPTTGACMPSGMYLAAAASDIATDVRFRHDNGGAVATLGSHSWSRLRSDIR